MLENIFGRTTKEKEPAPFKPLKVMGREPVSYEDPSFKFTEVEIADFRERGMTDAEIEVARRTVVNRQTRAQFEKNQLDG